MKSSLFVASALAGCLCFAFSTSTVAGTLSCLANGPQPIAGDTDGDLIPDASDRVPGDATSACLDFDGDGLNDLREYWFGTDYAVADSDDDGLQDGLEANAGLNPINAYDALVDTDGDGYLNAHEAWVGTDPRSPSSKPALVDAPGSGRFVLYPTDQFETHFRSSDGLTDLRADGSAVAYFQRSGLQSPDELANPTGTWSDYGTHISIDFDSGQLKALSYPLNDCAQSGSSQVQEWTYFDQRLIFPSASKTGRATWLVMDKFRVEIPECGIVESRVGPLTELRVSPPAELAQLELGQATWATWCAGSDAVFDGYLDQAITGGFYACRIASYGDGTGTNVDAGVPVSVGRATDGSQVVRYGDGSATRYYLIKDFGQSILVAILHEDAEGHGSSTVRMMTRRTESSWPAPAASWYQPRFDPLLANRYALDMRPDGRMYITGHDALSGDWAPPPFTYYSWEPEGERLVVRRYMTSNFRYVSDPSVCTVEPCFLVVQRFFTPESLSGDRIVISHRWEYYDVQDTNNDGLIDTSSLRSIFQDLRDYDRASPDLDLDGIVDSVDDDDDGDGLLDSWEVNYFNGESSDGFYRQTGEDDPDGDGFTNREEFEGGTDPLMPDSIPLRFMDAPKGYWAYFFIEKLAAAGITSGCGVRTYCPTAPVTRAQMAVFLVRGMFGTSFVPPAASGSVFGDVPAGAFAANFIEQLYADRITAGCGNGNYCPSSTVTRDQMAVFLLRAKHGASYSPPAATGLFSDVPVNYWAARWIEQLAREGVTAGCGGGKYCPSAVVTRDQMAVFLVRTFGL